MRIPSPQYGGALATFCDESAVPIVLVPRIGATLTFTALIVGQLTLAVALDKVGFLGVPKAEITPARLLGVALLIAGTLLITTRR